MDDINPELQEKLQELEHELEVCCHVSTEEIVFGPCRGYRCGVCYDAAGVRKLILLRLLFLANADFSCAQEGDITEKGYENLLDHY